ncbi:MAG: hypothetical protein KGJ07_10150, partial [Patescibacteria group bacterium]|nr:hypothetical protein [Patescibacteria group bacterium]
MKNISNEQFSGQIRESASLLINKTRHHQLGTLFFIQIDAYHAVGSDGRIYQLLSKDEGTGT